MAKKQERVKLMEEEDVVKMNNEGNIDENELP